MYAGRKLQSASIGGNDRALERARQKQRGRRTEGEDDKTDEGSLHGRQRGAQVLHCYYSPRCIVGGTKAQLGIQGVPHVAAFVVAVIKTETRFFYHNLTTSVMRNVLVYSHLLDFDFKSSFTFLWSWFLDPAEHQHENADDWLYAGVLMHRRVKSCYVELLLCCTQQNNVMIKT